MSVVVLAALSACAAVGMLIAIAGLTGRQLFSPVDVDAVVARSGRSLARLAMVGVAALFAGWHWAAERVFKVPAHEASSVIAWTVVAVGFGALFAAQSLVQLRPNSRAAQKLHTWLFAGLYLDERFARLTFRVWPPRITPGSSFRPALLLSTTMAPEETAS